MNFQPGRGISSFFAVLPLSVMVLLSKWGQVSARVASSCVTRGTSAAFVQSPLSTSANKRRLLLPSCNSIEIRSRSPPAAPLRRFASSTGTDATNNADSISEKDARVASLLFPSFSPSDYTLHTCTTNHTTLHSDGILLSQDLPLHQRIVSFGDVHGDLTALIQFLVTAKIMALPSSMEEALKKPRWIGGTTICIQCGDILDRGPNELACFRLLSMLSQQARDEGGALICLYGNHEALNSVGLFQYADPSGNVEFELTVGKALDEMLGTNRWRVQFAGNEASRWSALEPGGLLADALLQNMKVACQVGRSTFVHAGLTKEHLTSMGGIKGMNDAARDWVMGTHHEEQNNEGDYESVQQVVAAAQRRAKAQSTSMPDCLGGGIGSPSPVWMRDYSSPHDKPPKNARAQHMMDEALAALGQDMQRMVMGHTPQSRINAALQGKAWRVDVGASRGVMGGTPEVLEIIHGGGDVNGDTDDVHILTLDGKRIPGKERHVVDFVL